MIYSEKDSKALLKKGFRIIRQRSEPPRLQELKGASIWRTFQKFNTEDDASKEMNKLLEDYKTLFHG